MTHEKENLDQILRRLKEIESRLSMLENSSYIPQKPGFDPEPEIEKYESISEETEDEGIESQVGEYGMAWLGNIVLFFGIIFLAQLLKNQGQTLLSTIFGFASVAGVYFMGYKLRLSFPVMSKLFTYNSYLLLFIVTLKLHFSPTDPLINNKFFGLLLLFIVIGSLLYLAYSRRTQILIGIVMIMIMVTAIFSDYTPVMLSLMVFIAGFSVYFVYKFGWWRLVIVSIFIVYLTFLLWSFNNPLITHTTKAVDTLQFSYIYLFACAFIYSMLTLLPASDETIESSVNASIILNGLGFSFITTLLILNFFQDNYYLLLGFISAFAIIYSAILQSKGIWKLSASLYALYGFAVLSITIAGIYKFPLAFHLLSIQSLLVVSMALWFRSRFIVLMNMGLFIILLIAYFIFPGSVNSINFSFALVALITARVLNWKKGRLEIRSEMMRNTYLILGFIMILFSLYRAVPEQYITLSWALTAALFFIFSILFRNIKYRWLAISTIIVTAFYFFLFNLRQVGIGYRIVALLFLAVISLSFSTYYAKRMKEKRIVNDTNDSSTELTD